MDDIFELILFLVILVGSAIFNIIKEKNKSGNRKNRNYDNTNPERPGYDDPNANRRYEQTYTYKDQKTQMESYRTPPPTYNTDYDDRPSYDSKSYSESINNKVLEEQKKLEDKVRRIKSGGNRPGANIKTNLVSPSAKAVESRRKVRILAMIKNPETVKDLIIAQEIFNKPKAFRE